MPPPLSSTKPKQRHKTNHRSHQSKRTKTYYAASMHYWASQPDMVRSQQKDSFYQRFLLSQIIDWVGSTLGNRYVHKFYKEIKLMSELTYYCLTTLSGKQTIGEEYCDIMQSYALPKSRNTLPSFPRRVILVILNVFIPYISSKLETFPLTRIQQVSDNKQIMMKGYNKILNIIGTTSPQISKFHLALFYIQGYYMSISKRFTSIRYIQLDRRQSQPSYQILGLLILIQQVVQIGIWARQWHRQRSSSSWLSSIFSWKQLNDDDDLDNNNKVDNNIDSNDILDTKSENTCALCLEYRKDTTATPCGHLFCWTCVMEWCSKHPKCPICRTPVSMNSLAPVYHFD